MTDMRQYKLYDYWRSSAAFRVRIALNLKGLDYVQESVHLVRDGGEQHQAAFHSLNPQERVPVLEVLEPGRGDAPPVLVTQSLTIIEYLNEQSPEPSIYPADLSLKSKVHAFAQAIACDIHPLNNLSVLQYLQSPLQISAEQQQAWYEHWIATGFRALEETLQPFIGLGSYCFGPDPTLADIMLVPQAYNAHRFKCSMETYPRINQIYESCLQHEAFSRALPENQPDAPE
ncbi:maleylacetoacetate isomerase [Oleiphilus messinensis]|uniref:Maleylacetoacetate isomerase n=2 Tax=Oleiphilus messinensis TaxID=141451 RepID=A0A1Y0IIG7_9GAMM|nr:maleylacetoacetate isomerase [Oleiphilus messinensis]